jgi:hypothetical protein
VEDNTSDSNDGHDEQGHVDPAGLEQGALVPAQGTNQHLQQQQ